MRVCVWGRGVGESKQTMTTTTKTNTRTAVRSTQQQRHVDTPSRVRHTHTQDGNWRTGLKRRETQREIEQHTRRWVYAGTSQRGEAHSQRQEGADKEEQKKREKQPDPGDHVSQA